MLDAHNLTIFPVRAFRAATSFYNIGHLQLKLGNFKTAEQNAAKAVAIRTKLLGEHHHATVSAANIEGMAQDGTQNAKDAQAFSVGNKAEIDAAHEGHEAIAPTQRLPMAMRSRRATLHPVSARLYGVIHGALEPPRTAESADRPAPTVHDRPAPTVHDLFNGFGHIGLYFGAFSAEPCEQFEDILAMAYEAVKLEYGPAALEIIYVSGDDTEKAFAASFRGAGGMRPGMLWPAVPFAASAERAQLANRYQVYSRPQLVILDTRGNVVSRNACAAVEADFRAGMDPTDDSSDVDPNHDPWFKNFPWADRSPRDLLGDQFSMRDKSTETTETVPGALDGKTIGVYFVRSDTGPSKAFSAVLERRCAQLKDRGSSSFEVVMVVMDKGAGATGADWVDGDGNDVFGAALDVLPGWMAVPADATGISQALVDAIGISGVPSLAIVSSKGEIISTDACSAIEQDESCLEFPWPPLAVSRLQHCDTLNERPTLIVLAEALNDAMADELLQRLQTAACIVFEDTKDIGFAVAFAGDAFAPIVRGICECAEDSENGALAVLILDIRAQTYYPHPDLQINGKKIIDMTAADFVNWVEAYGNGLLEGRPVQQ